MSKKGRFFKKRAAQRRTYERSSATRKQEIGILRTNVKVQITKIVEFFRKVKRFKYGTS